MSTTTPTVVAPSAPAPAPVTKPEENVATKKQGMALPNLWREASIVATPKGRFELILHPDAMDAAVARFKNISTSLGGHEQAQAFFATYGTDGFKPEERELIKGKELTLDSEIKDHNGKGLGLPTRPEGFGAKYADEPAWEIEEPSDISVASALKTEEWQELFDSTKVLHGYVLKPGRAVSRARFQAFQLKPKPGETYTSSNALKPDYEVFDASSISIKETKSSVERSMAQNGFSSEAISASVSVV